MRQWAELIVSHADPESHRPQDEPAELIYRQTEPKQLPRFALDQNPPEPTKQQNKPADKDASSAAVTRRASMVFFPGMLTEAASVKPGQLLEMFDSSWKVRSIWDGVKLEVVEDRSPVVLHSFTHLDPDLPLVEVRKRRRKRLRPFRVAGSVCCYWENWVSESEFDFLG